ncbi:hypothetical protein [Kitasatospora sp. NPDC087271]|uniref:hypothetical protein n=1 Tax=Kitasatospora sp. NPDC087271 TaxID=3364067 RepID=UPI0038066447
MICADDLCGRRALRVVCSWFHSTDGDEPEPELVHMWLLLDGLGPVLFHTIDHILDLRIDEPHGSYDMGEYGHVTVGDAPDDFPLAPFVGHEILTVRHVRQLSLDTSVGIVAGFATGDVRILALADDLVVTASRLSDTWEGDLEVTSPVASTDRD